jgi:hypothetical protein
MPFSPIRSCDMSDEPVGPNPNAPPGVIIPPTDPPPPDVGGEPTLPGQTEVVAGTPEHEALLNAYPNATSYAPDVNVVLPADVPPEEPMAEEAAVQEDAQEERDPFAQEDAP